MTHTEQVIASGASHPHTEVSDRPVKQMVDPGGLLFSQDIKTSLCTAPLGAGVAVAVYDPKLKAGGILHSLLPDSKLDAKRANGRPGIFIDTGFKALLKGICELQALRENLLVFIAGGAEILDETELFNLGKSNCDILSQLLREMKIPVQARHVGGRTSCSIELIIATGEVLLKLSGRATSKSLCKPLKTT